MRQGLPADVLRLRQESGALAEKVAGVTGAAVAVLEQRLTETSEALARTEEMLRQVDRGIALLAQAEVDARWVARSLANFESVWDVMTPENRGRLVRALVENVEVDGATGSVTVTLAELQLPPMPKGKDKPQGGNHANAN